VNGGRLWTLAILAAIGGGANGASAHELQPGYLELREVSPQVYDMVWKRPGRGELELWLDPRLPTGCVPAVVPPGSQAPGPGDVRRTLRCPGGLAGQTIAIDGIGSTLADVLLQVHHGDGRIETHLLSSVSPRVTLAGASPRLARAAAYLRLGVEHIVLGVDHLLFVLGLVLIVRHRRRLVQTITSFTVAHSITLAVATLGHTGAPVLPLNATIALSILFLGPEIVRARRGETSLTLRHPWVVAFAFGLLHGFGFASGLASMGLPEGEIPLALLLFNLGVEAGQLLFVLLVLALERACRALEVRWPGWVEALPGYAVGTLGAYWTLQRTALLLGVMR
jgi:hydrogenase/urease accessory protein HupE